MQRIRFLLIPILLVILALTGSGSMANAQSGPNLGPLAVYWLDSSGRQDHPDANGNLLQQQYCTGTLPFFVYIDGDTAHSEIDRWETEVQVHRGVRGSVSHRIRTSPDSSAYKELYGRLTLDGGDMSLSLRIRGQVDGSWGPWSSRSGLFCMEVPAVATITTRDRNIGVNEDDAHTIEVRFDRPMQLNTPLNLRLRREWGSYPKFRGWPADNHKTVIVRQGQSSIDVELQSIDDDIVNDTKQVNLDLLPGRGYQLGTKTTGSFLSRASTAAGDADFVVYAWPRCGTSQYYISQGMTPPAGSISFDEDAGRVRIPLTTIEGGHDYQFGWAIVNNRGSAADNNDYRFLTNRVEFQPHVSPHYVELDIVDSDQLEQNESLFLELYETSTHNTKFRYQCKYVEISIIDDDTANFSIEEDSHRNIAEGETISFTVNLDGENGNCLLRGGYFTFTPSGDTSALAALDRTAKRVRFPGCVAQKEVTFSGLEQTGNQGTKRISFNVRMELDQFADRVTLNGRRSSSARYSVTITDSENTNTNQNVPRDDDPQPTRTPKPTPEPTPEPDPFTASFQNTPGSHDGSPFTFELRLSEKPKRGFSYKTLRDHAFDVQGGNVSKVSRIVKRKNLRWNITVTPDGDGDLTVILPPTTDCEAQGAICTDDGRKLSNQLQLQVAGASQ